MPHPLASGCVVVAPANVRSRAVRRRRDRLRLLPGPASEPALQSSREGSLAYQVLGEALSTSSPGQSRTCAGRQGPTPTAHSTTRPTTHAPNRRACRRAPGLPEMSYGRLASRMSRARPRGSVARRSSSFRFHPDAVERSRNGRFPLPSDLISPPSARSPEVCSELSAVLEPRRPVVLIKREALDDVRNGAAQQSEVDRRWRCEPDGLHGCRHRPTSNRCSVRRQHHVAAALENGDLLGHRSWGPPQVRRGDHLEHRLPGSRDGDGQRAEWPQRPPNAGVQRQLSADDEPVAQAADSGRGQRRETEYTHQVHSCTPAMVKRPNGHAEQITAR